jgi:hypothetical protein
MKSKPEDMLTQTTRAKIKWSALIKEVEPVQVVISRGPGAKGRYYISSCEDEIPSLEI